MPRYRFTCEGAYECQDEDGTDLRDLAAARLQAMTMAGEIIRDHAHDFAAHPHWRMTVLDETGPQFILEFSLGAPDLNAQRRRRSLSISWAR